MCQEAIKEYPTSYEEDLKVLEREDLTFNQSNSVLYRSGEKVILNFFLDLIPKILNLFDMELNVSSFGGYFCLESEEGGSGVLLVQSVQRLYFKRDFGAHP